jgi:KaiC/GvpD/RAD55 family RecA-like ATPase/DNA-binding NarL/FixJ family response regulator
MLRSGIAPVDARLGGLQPGHIHLFLGGPGSGKSSACLHFLDEGMRRGETAALVTLDRASELESHAGFLGLSVRPRLRDGLLVALRYRRDFASRLRAAGSTTTALDDLARLLGTGTFARLVVDPCSLLLGDGTQSDAAAAALAELLERSATTTIVTLSADVAQLSDRRTAPLVERCATILRFDLEPGRARRLHVVRARQAVANGDPIEFSIDARQGIRCGGARSMPRTRARAHGGHLVVRRLSRLSDETVELFRRHHPLIELAGESDADGDSLSRAAAVLIETSHQLLDETATRIDTLSRRADAPPILVLTSFTMRSSDRVRLLQAGADDIIAGDMSSAESLQRLEAAIERGHRAPPALPPAVTRSTRPAERRSDHEGLVSGAELSHLVRGALASPGADFAVVRLTPADGDRASLLEVVLRSIRSTTGDVVADGADDVLVFLYGARRRDAAAFVDRLRELRATRGESVLRSATLTVPQDALQIQQLFEVTAPA